MVQFHFHTNEPNHLILYSTNKSCKTIPNVIGGQHVWCIFCICSTSAFECQMACQFHPCWYSKHGVHNGSLCLDNNCHPQFRHGRHSYFNSITLSVFCGMSDIMLLTLSNALCAMSTHRNCYIFLYSLVPFFSPILKPIPNTNNVEITLNPTVRISSINLFFLLF